MDDYTNKIKVLNVFENKELMNTLESNKSLNKFEFEKGIILNAITPKSSNKFNKIEEKEKKNNIIFKEQCEYCLTNFAISGHLSLTKESLFFEPDLRDQNVIENGYGSYQIFIDLYDIYECAHIVIPTRNTYLCNNEDTCGFIQVLLKSIYNKIILNDSISSKNNFEHTKSKKNINSGGLSYYKYFSKSLSYVYNHFAHTLAQNTVLKEEKNETKDNMKNINKIKKKSNDNSTLNKYLDNKMDTLNSNDNNGSINNENNINCKRKKSILNFDLNAKNNIDEHFKDNDLKIYQKINEAHYSNLSGAFPIITYKNNINEININEENKKNDEPENKYKKSDNSTTISKDYMESTDDNLTFCEKYFNKEMNENDKKDSIQVEMNTMKFNNKNDNLNMSINTLNNKNYNIKQCHNFNRQKSIEEKSFVLFRFFNNAKAYETTIKIIKEIDRVKNSEKIIKNTITSVPFTSNELLNNIIEESLKENDISIAEEKKKKKEQKYQVIEPKLEYIKGSAHLLTKNIAKQINYYLPPTINIKTWRLAFCSSIHGISFKTLYNNVYNKGPVLILIYDMNNVLFGYYSNKLHCDNCYYGSGENFLFSFKPNNCNKNNITNISESDNNLKKNINENINKNDQNNQNDHLNILSNPNDLNNKEIYINNNENNIKNKYNNEQNHKHNIEYNINNKNNNEYNEEINLKTKNNLKTLESKKENNDTMKVYFWSTKNTCFIFSDEQSIMIGGGDNYALVINEDLCKGQTNKSSTYDNDLLTYDEEFEIQFIQLWTFHDY